MYFGTNIRKDFRLKKFFRNLFSFYFLVSQHANLHLLIYEHWFGIRANIATQSTKWSIVEQYSMFLHINLTILLSKLY